MGVAEGRVCPGDWPSESCSALTKALRVPVLTERASAANSDKDLVILNKQVMNKQ